MPILKVEITEEELERLKDLAKHRKMSPESCIRSFIQTCQPGGSGWKHPSTAPVVSEKSSVVASEGGEER